MKILTLWIWAFWFAICKLLWENNPKQVFYWLELNNDRCEILNKTKKHPYFFEWYKLPDNVEIVCNYDEIIWDIDLLILAIPTQCIWDELKRLKWKLKSWITILNLAKWIDLKNNITISQLIEQEFGDFDYNYAILSGGMIAEEVVKQKNIWADLACSNDEMWKKIQELFACDYFKVDLRKEILNIELYGSLKNILAIITWYYEGKWENASTIWYYINEFYNEMKDLVKLYWGNENIDFSYYSLGWDIIATCFGGSRNRYFGRLLWEWNSVEEVLDILKKENKHSEGYETLKAVYSKIWDRKGFELVKKFYGKIY